MAKHTQPTSGGKWKGEKERMQKEDQANMKSDSGKIVTNIFPVLVLAYGAINDPCVFVIFADWMQVALEIDACATDVTSLGWSGVGMLTFMLTCVTCTTDVTSLG
jgi:hypothetical protein